MRRRRAAALAVATLTAGCNGLFGGRRRGGDRERADDDARTRTGTGTGTGTGGAGESTAAGPPLDAPAGVVVRNATTRDRFATVAVADGDGAELGVESGSLAPTATLSLPRIAARAGTYRAVVDTADGARRAVDWRAAPPAPHLAVDLRGPEGVVVRRLARCDPACELSTVRAGERVHDPRRTSPGGEVAAPGPPPARLVLDNGADAARVAAVRVGEADPALDADYRVPARGRVVVPLPRRARYAVRVAVDGRATTRRWSPAAVGRLTVGVGSSPPAVRCRDVRRDLLVINDDDVARTVAVAVAPGRDGTRPTVERSFALPADGRRSAPGAIPPADGYDLTVDADDGLRETYAWDVCPPLGPVEVLVTGDDVRVSVRAPGSGAAGSSARSPPAADG